jgi:hypothetical protein
MGLPLFKEKRFGVREQLTGLMPGKLSIPKSKKQLSAKPVDVSPNGLGLILDAQLTVGAKLNLTIGNRIIELEVVWVEADFSKRDLFRYGMTCKDSGVDLAQEFRDAGCLMKT